MARLLVVGKLVFAEGRDVVGLLAVVVISPW